MPFAADAADKEPAEQVLPVVGPADQARAVALKARLRPLPGHGRHYRRDRDADPLRLGPLHPNPGGVLLVAGEPAADERALVDRIAQELRYRRLAPRAPPGRFRSAGCEPGRHLANADAFLGPAIELAHEFRLLLHDTEPAWLPVGLTLRGLLRPVAKGIGAARDEPPAHLCQPPRVRPFNQLAPLALRKGGFDGVEHLSIGRVLGRARQEFHLPEGMQLGQDSQAEDRLTGEAGEVIDQHALSPARAEQVTDAGESGAVDGLPDAILPLRREAGVGRRGTVRQNNSELPTSGLREAHEQVAQVGGARRPAQQRGHTEDFLDRPQRRTVRVLYDVAAPT